MMNKYRLHDLIVLIAMYLAAMVVLFVLGASDNMIMTCVCLLIGAICGWCLRSLD